MKRLLPLLVCLCLLTGGCSAPAGEEDGTLHILTTTYPVYLLTTALVGETEGVEVSRLIDQEISCLHDYTLTVTDMKAIEGADVLVLSGAGLEAFMADALAQSDAAVIDCSAGVELLPSLEAAGEQDPHFWMDPARAVGMMEEIAVQLDRLTGGDDGPYHTAFLAASERLEQARQGWEERTAPLSGVGLITFHDGFQYFAGAFGLELLAAIEEEEGSEASAAEIKEVSALVRDRRVSAIFTEKNGSDATARAISRETGAAVYQLDLLMSGEESGIEGYITAMDANVQALVEALT